MKELTCIGCPRGCTLKIERDGDGWSVTGNTCPRGREFAVSEMTAPRRTICSTVRTSFPGAPVLPVRVSPTFRKTASSMSWTRSKPSPYQSVSAAAMS